MTSGNLPVFYIWRDLDFRVAYENSCRTGKPDDSTILAAAIVA